MSSFAPELAIALLLCLQACRAEQPKHREQFERELAENWTLPEAVCHREEESQKSQATCVISKLDRSCNATLKAPNGSVLGRITRAVPYGKDRAIVIWRESGANASFLKFRAIDLATCGEPSAAPEEEAKLAQAGNDDSYLAWAVSVATYDSTYDVFYVDEQARKYCKRSFATESAEAIGKLVCIDNNFSPPFYTSYYPIEPFASTPKGYVLLLPSHERTIDAWFIGPDDDDALRFARYSTNLPARRFAVSTSHNTITICHQQRLDAEATLVNCTRFSMISGRKKQETELRLVDGAKISDAFNLSDGGYLLALTKRSPADCRGNDAERVMKISKDNVTFFPIDREPFDCGCAMANVRTRMFENERREYCLTTICDRLDPGDRQYNNSARTQCFSDRELAVKTFTV